MTLLSLSVKNLFTFCSKACLWQNMKQFPSSIDLIRANSQSNLKFNAVDRRMYSHGDQCQIFREPAQSSKRFLRPKRFCEHNTRIRQISFLRSLNILFVGSEHFYNDSKRFREICVEVTMNCHSTNSDKKPCPKTLLQGFFVNVWDKSTKVWTN